MDLAGAKCEPRERFRMSRPFLDRRVSVAPMMDWTDRHCRYFLRGFSPDLLLYTEMVTASAILRGDREKLLEYYREEGEKALASATDRLQQQQLEATPHISVGDAGKIICDFATDKAATEIIMGTHGRGVLAGALIGSVAQKVVHLAPVPVVLVK